MLACMPCMLREARLCARSAMHRDIRCVCRAAAVRAALRAASSARTCERSAPRRTDLADRGMRALSTSLCALQTVRAGRLSASPSLSASPPPSPSASFSRWIATSHVSSSRSRLLKSMPIVGGGTSIFCCAACDLAVSAPPCSCASSASRTAHGDALCEPSVGFVCGVQRRVRGRQTIGGNAGLMHSNRARCCGAGHGRSPPCHRPHERRALMRYRA
jgi:hypothetical protein